MPSATQRSHAGRTALFLCPLTFLFLPSPSSGRTWRILNDGSGDAPTIQEGINSAADGDTVLVGPGSYFETIDFLGKDIVVRSSAGSEATIIDGSAAGGCVVKFVSGESRAATLEGFTITGGGPGICLSASEATIQANAIVENRGQSSGGIYCTGQWTLTVPPLVPVIEDNKIIHNTAYYSGPGIWVWGTVSPQIVGNEIAWNEAIQGDGGAIYMNTNAAGTIIRGNYIHDNIAGDHGGGIYLGMPLGTTVPGAIEIANNLVWRNQALARARTGTSGGGIWLFQADAWVHHNTIVENYGGGVDSTWGGGIALQDVGSPWIERNIIAFSLGGGPIWCTGGATPTIENNLFWSNVGDDRSGTCGRWWEVGGNIEADPYFCNAGSGDYTLTQDSPGITHPGGPLGAFPNPGCAPVAAKPTTWGRIKAMYASPGPGSSPRPGS